MADGLNAKPVTTAMERTLLDGMADALNGLSTSELAEVYAPGIMTAPRAGFGRVAADLGLILSDLLKRGLVYRTSLSAGWKITPAGYDALRLAAPAPAPAREEGR